MSGTIRICPNCGAAVPTQAPHGLCPKCVLVGAVTPTDTVKPGVQNFAPAPLNQIAAAFSHLEILQLIGAGGMGAVYKARQPKLERFVALKILPEALAGDPAFAERFSREARVLARLNHPNIVTVYDFGQAGGFFYLLMEFVNGVNLRQAMRAARFTPTQALALVPKICDALQFAHDEGILHRDIKPENILLDSKGRVKIADFGIAKLVGDRAEEARLTASGLAVGTPHYMAPEQLEHPQDVDQRADIYSLGVVLYEMLTGELPIGRFAPPSKKTDLDERVDDVVLRALEKERERRYRSASEMKTRVEGVTPRPPSSSASADERRQTLPAAVANDFILCNPRLPRMAQAITVFALLVAPILWLIGLLASQEPHQANPYAVFVQTLMDKLVHLGETFVTAVLIAGGIKLRNLKRSGPPLIIGAVCLHLACLCLAILGVIWLELLKRGHAPEADAPLPMGEAVYHAIAVASMVFEIWSLAWLRRNATRLREIFDAAAPALTPAKATKPGTARHATLSAVLTAISFALGMPLLAGVVFLGLMLQQNANLPGLGPAELAIAATNIALIVGLGLGGLLTGLGALHQVRLSGGLIHGLKRALFSTLTWPALTLSGLVALATSASLGGFVVGGRAFAFNFVLTAALALAADTLLVFGVWRWAVVAPGNRRTADNLVVLGITACLLLVPSSLAAFFSGMLPVFQAVHRHAATTTTSGTPQSGTGTDWMQVTPSPEVRLQSGNALPRPTASKRGIAADFVLPPHQAAVFEVVTRSNQVIVPVPRLAAYVVNGAAEPYAGKFLWADNPADLDGQTGLPRWKFGIIGPDGNNLEQGLGVPPAPASYAGNLDLWTALKPDCEVLEGLPDSASPHPAYGLRIRTQTYDTAPGQTYRSVGRGTNWTPGATSPAVPASP